jgi:hypothetical protein
MTRARIIIISIIAFSAAIIIGYFVSVLEIFPNNKLDSSLRKAIQNKRGGILTIQEITPFRWDRLDIYTPYSTYKDEKGKMIDIDEGHCLLVFSENGVPVSLLNYKRYYGDFSGLTRKDGYNPSTARFKVLDKNHSNWIKLEWAQGESPTTGSSGFHR